MLKRNIGSADRLFRLVVALGLFVYAYQKSSWPAYLAGGFVLFEALYGWCVMYQLLGKNSCPLK
jgi:hypothetical protein